MKYRKKAVEVEAVRVGDATSGPPFKGKPQWFNNAFDNGYLQFRDGRLYLSDGRGDLILWETDRIIMESPEIFLHCGVDTFEATYEPVEEIGPGGLLACPSCKRWQRYPKDAKAMPYFPSSALDRCHVCGDRALPVEGKSVCVGENPPISPGELEKLRHFIELFKLNYPEEHATVSQVCDVGEALEAVKEATTDVETPEFIMIGDRVYHADNPEDMKDLGDVLGNFSKVCMEKSLAGYLCIRADGHDGLHKSAGDSIEWDYSK